MNKISIIVAFYENTIARFYCQVLLRRVQLYRHSSSRGIRYFTVEIQKRFTHAYRTIIELYRMSENIEPLALLLIAASLINRPVRVDFVSAKKVMTIIAPFRVQKEIIKS